MRQAIEILATIFLLCIVVVPLVVAAFLVSPYTGLAAVAVMVLFAFKK